MGNLESIIKSEIQRLAKREIRSTFTPLRREVRATARGGQIFILDKLEMIFIGF